MISSPSESEATWHSRSPNGPLSVAEAPESPTYSGQFYIPKLLGSRSISISLLGHKRWVVASQEKKNEVLLHSLETNNRLSYGKVSFFIIETKLFRDRISTEVLRNRSLRKASFRPNRRFLTAHHLPIPFPRHYQISEDCEFHTPTSNTFENELSNSRIQHRILLKFVLTALYWTYWPS